MKKYISICFLFALLISSLTLSGCGDDDSNQEAIESSIIGKWQLVSVSPHELAEECDECEFQGYIEFESNGTYSDHRPCGVNDIGGGRWELDGNKVQIISDILPVPIEFGVELTDNTLILSQSSAYYNEDWELVPCVLKQTYQRVD